MMEPTPPNMTPEDYATQAAVKARREMAMALLKDGTSGGDQKLTSPWQVFGNAGKAGLGAHQMGRADQLNRNSLLHDSSEAVNGMWGAQGSGVPYAPPAPGVNYSPTGNTPSSTPGMPGGVGNVPPMKPAQAGWQPPNQSPPMNPAGAVPFIANALSGGKLSNLTQSPWQGGIFGGLGWEPHGWGDSLKNTPPSP